MYQSYLVRNVWAFFSRKRKKKAILHVNDNNITRGDKHVFCQMVMLNRLGRTVLSRTGMIKVLMTTK